MSAGKPFGLTPFDVNFVNLSFGSGYPLTYAELGYMLSAMMKKIPEWVVRPRFLNTCRKGLVTFESWEQMSENIRDRKIVTTEKGIAAIRDVGLLMNRDPESQRYYRLFDPNEDYSKRPELLDRFSPFQGKFKGKKKMPTRQQILDRRWREKQGIHIDPQAAFREERRYI